MQRASTASVVLWCWSNEATRRPVGVAHCVFLYLLFSLIQTLSSPPLMSQCVCKAAERLPHASTSIERWCVTHQVDCKHPSHRHLCGRPACAFVNIGRSSTHITPTTCTSLRGSVRSLCRIRCCPGLSNTSAASSAVRPCRLCCHHSAACDGSICHSAASEDSMSPTSSPSFTSWYTAAAGASNTVPADMPEE
jgi:hypothetical protein